MGVRVTELFLFIALLTHIFVALFTKVEESFNIQAIHDFIYHRNNWTQFDHKAFPGVVPRTFVGPFVVASAVSPLLPIVNYFGLKKTWMLLAARIALGTAVLTAFCSYCRCVENRFGKRTGMFLRLIALSQFHFLFYASRPLPNTFAMVFVLLVFRKWIEGGFFIATIYATIAACLFRLELVLLFGPMFFHIFLGSPRKILVMISVGFCTLFCIFVLTIPFDSFMWGRTVWPEGEVFRFNIVQNRSHKYGVMPFWWYFTSAIPRALLCSTPLALLGVFASQRNQKLIVLTVMPACTFLLLYSNLPHKELRFVLYVVPLLNLSAAFFCDWVWKRASRGSFLFRLLALSTIAHLIMNSLMTSHFLYASSRNYPGSDALIWLQHKQRSLREKPISVHIDNYCAETGISRFAQLYAAWEYNKTENLPPKEFSRFDFILIGAMNKKSFLQNMTNNNIILKHEEYLEVQGFHELTWLHLPGPSWLPFTLRFPTLTFEPKVVVLMKT